MSGHKLKRASQRAINEFLMIFAPKTLQIEGNPVTLGPEQAVAIWDDEDIAQAKCYTCDHAGNRWRPLGARIYLVVA